MVKSNHWTVTANLHPAAPQKRQLPLWLWVWDKKALKIFPPSWNCTEIFLSENHYVGWEYHACESLINCSYILSVKCWASHFHSCQPRCSSQQVSLFLYLFARPIEKAGQLHPSSPFGRHSVSFVHKPCIVSKFSPPINILNLCSLAFAKAIFAIRMAPFLLSHWVA